MYRQQKFLSHQRLRLRRGMAGAASRWAAVETALVQHEQCTFTQDQLHLSAYSHAARVTYAQSTLLLAGCKLRCSIFFMLLPAGTSHKCMLYKALESFYYLQRRMCKLDFNSGRIRGQRPCACAAVTQIVNLSPVTRACTGAHGICERPSPSFHPHSALPDQRLAWQISSNSTAHELPSLPPFFGK